MTAAVRLSTAQRDALDTALLAAVLAGPGRRASVLLRDPAIVEVIGSLPTGKSDMRYLDNAFQRLRLSGAIRCNGGRWYPVKAGRR